MRQVVITLGIALSACTSPSEQARDISRELVYFKDSRTEQCFAYWTPNGGDSRASVMAGVPCSEKVEALLVNSAERPVSR